MPLLPEKRVGQHRNVFVRSSVDRSYLLDQQLCATTLLTAKDDNDSYQFGKNPLNTLCLGCVRRVGDG